MAKWHNKHISTKWGIAILGWLLVSVALLIPVLGQEQDNRSSAYVVYPSPTKPPAPTPSCRNMGGFCQAAANYCRGNALSGLKYCGSSSLECCKPW